MVEYDIEGLRVNFPYEAYPCQIRYMERVIACLNKGWNGIFESPTGTGKTLCLLCATLAWQQNEKRQRMKEATAQLAAYCGENTSSQDDMNQCITYPKILYTSRTHMQLSQVVRELNKTVYKRVKTCLMGSRDQLCIHEDVKNEQNSSIKNHLCRAKVKKGNCRFYVGYEIYQNALKPHDKKKKGASGRDNKKDFGNKRPLEEEDKRIGSVALDIEDFISFGERNKICPFFASRDKPEEADLILMPYNYVVDAKARRANKIDLKNVILIFDEAHNMEQVCEESASFMFTTKDISGAVRECKEAMNMILLDEEGLRREMDETKSAFGMLTKEDKKLVDISLKELADLIVILEDWEKEMDKVDLKAAKTSSNSLSGSTRPGNFMVDLLHEAGISPFMRETIFNLIDKLTAYLTEKAANSTWQSRGAHLQKLGSLLNTVFSMDDDDEDCAKPKADYKNHCRHFKVYISPLEEGNRSSASLNGFVKTARRHLQLNYWCFDAGLTMQSLVQKDVYSVLVTSGTLSPLNHFQSQMKIPFHLTLENDHVIKADQTWFGVICSGPDGCPLDASFANRQNDTYISSLGNMLVNVFRLVPEGSLVFFASYAQMTTCIDKWKGSGIWDRMTKHKALYVEPKSKQEFYTAIGEYNDVVKSKPAAFFAVCRGKVSEGIDFADSAARAVLILGIPYPPVYDPRVVLKKEYLGAQEQSQRHGQDCSQASSNTDTPPLDGETWYRTEAIRSINQSIGRVIRHKDDYGAVILADQRFMSWNKGRFPSWIVSNYSSYTKFGEFSKSLAQFFKDKVQRRSEKLPVGVPKENGFEENASLRKRDLDGNVKEKPLERLTLNPGSSTYTNSVTDDYVNSFSSNSPVRNKRLQSASGTIWENLDNGKQIPEPEIIVLDEYQPASIGRLELPIGPVTQRRRIKIKKAVKKDDEGNVNGETPCKAANEKQERDPAMVQKASEYRNLLRQQLNPDDCRELLQLARTYKEDRLLDPLLEFFSRLPFEECSDVIRRFIDCVTSEHKSTFLEFLKKLEQT